MHEIFESGKEPFLEYYDYRKICILEKVYIIS